MFSLIIFWSNVHDIMMILIRFQCLIKLCVQYICTMCIFNFNEMKKIAYLKVFFYAHYERLPISRLKKKNVLLQFKDNL